MEPDRVVVINDRSAAIGGASNLSLLSARLLRGMGVPVTFFAGDGPGASQPAGTINLGEAPLLERTRPAALVGGLYNGRARAALEALIDEADTPGTVYHVHGWTKILSPAVFHALARVRERVVLHAHDYFLACPNGGFVNYRKAAVCPLVPMSARCLATHCDKRGFHQKVWRVARHGLRQGLFDIRRRPANIVLVHEGMRAYFERAGIACERMVAIRNPVSPVLTEGAEPWKARAFFFVGRLEPEKGFEDAALAARRAGVPLHVIGDGAGRALLEARYPEVVLHGWCDRRRMRRLMAGARALVVSSRVPEPFGLAALEAAGSGIPLVLPSEALLSREIVAADCGLDFAAGDVGALAAAMRRLAGDDRLVRYMSHNGFREAPGMGNTASSWAAALLSVYGDVIARAPGAGRAAARAGGEGRVRASVAATNTFGRGAADTP